MADNAQLLGGLQFGSLCNILREVSKNCLWVPYYNVEKLGYQAVGVTQKQVVDTVYSLILSDEECARMLVPASEKEASFVVRNLSPIRPEFRQMASLPQAAEKIRRNFCVRIDAHFSDRQRHNLLTKLGECVEQIPDDLDKRRLKANFPMTYDQKQRIAYQNVVAECIRWCFETPNTVRDAPSKVALRCKPQDILAYDPSGRGSIYSKSTAIRMVLREGGLDSEEVLYDGYSYERCLERILNESLVLEQIDCGLGYINIAYAPRQNNAYSLRRVEETDYSRVRNFIFQHQNEFLTKKWWRAPLHEMVFHGLELEKWTAYAYYNSYGDIIAYLDYKIRTDGDFEIGTQLTAHPCRGQHLATGLLNFLRFKFLNTCFFTGTYEENASMRHILEKAGFREHLFYDSVTGVASNRIAERINPNFPEDDAKMTNSVYYYANSLASETRLGAVQVDSQMDPEAGED